jgi:hypothetical protein
MAGQQGWRKSWAVVAWVIRALMADAPLSAAVILGGPGLAALALGRLGREARLRVASWRARRKFERMLGG